MANFRPVSNLPFISKILEKVVHTRLHDYLNTNNLQEVYQSVYRKGHSTETALIRVHNDILMALSARKACLLLLLDLSSAFDTVYHAGLVDVLAGLGIRETALEWFVSYLCSRHQNVRIGNHMSPPKPLTSGVPQGSVLGPVLFSLYTASLGPLIESHSLSYHFYADDTSLYLTFESSELISAISQMQHCAEDVRQWMSMKKLKMNNGKTEFLLIAPRSVSRNLPDDVPVLTVGDTDVAPMQMVRYIGILMDSHMTMEEHINHMCKTARLHLHRIGRIRHILTDAACAKLIHAFVSSRMDYGCALLAGLPQRQLTKLQRVQNSAARLLSRVGHREHITPTLHRLHWLPVVQRIQFRIAVTVFKAIHGLAPVYLQELLQSHSIAANFVLRSDSSHFLHVPRSFNQLSDRAFSVIGPKIWNFLDPRVREADSLSVFIKRLKTFLFTQAFYA